MSGAVIIGAGARTPLGFNRPASIAAVRADIAVIGEHPFMIDRFGDPMMVTLDPGLDIGTAGADRMAGMAIAAAKEALAPVASIDPKLTIGVAFSTGEARPGLDAGASARVADQLEDALSEEFQIARVSHRMGGHAGGIAALQAALNLLDRDGIDVALAGGVDSYIDPETLEWLDETEQLHSENNIYGFCPGEAAGFVALMRDDRARQVGARPLLRLTAVGSGLERNLIKTEDIVVGEGLAAAFADASAALPTGAQVDRIICDMNGERYRGNEYGFSVLRTPNLFRDAADFEAPADCWGDVGAASAPLYAAMIIEAETRGYSKGPLSLVWASSEAGLRGAAVFDRVGDL